MGDLVYLTRAEDLDDLPTGPPIPGYDQPQLLAADVPADLVEWWGGPEEDRIDWSAETVGPLTRPRLVALDGGASAPENSAGQTGRPAEDAQTDRPGGQHE